MASEPPLMNEAGGFLDIPEHHTTLQEWWLAWLTSKTGTGNDERKVNTTLGKLHPCLLLCQVRRHKAGRAYARAGVVSYMGLRQIYPDPKPRQPYSY